MPDRTERPGRRDLPEIRNSSLPHGCGRDESFFGGSVVPGGGSCAAVRSAEQGCVRGPDDDGGVVGEVMETCRRACRDTGTGGRVQEAGFSGPGALADDRRRFGAVRTAAPGTQRPAPGILDGIRRRSSAASAFPGPPDPLPDGREPDPVFFGASERQVVVPDDLLEISAVTT